jgi:hypothetical protein
MEAEVTNVNNSVVSNCEFKEEVSEVDTDILSDEKDTTSSEEESSTQLCSLSSGQRRNVSSCQRHPSVDQWLLGRFPRVIMIILYICCSRTFNKYNPSKGASKGSRGCNK